MLYRYPLPCLLLLLLVLASPLAHSNEATTDTNPLWVSSEGEIQLYLFWSLTCPHCLEARPLIQEMAQQRPWLQLHDLEVSQNPTHGQHYQRMAALFQQQPTSVPALFFCGQMVVGFDPNHSPQQLATLLDQCRAGNGVLPTSTAAAPVLPQLGGLSMEGWSLPMITIAIAAMDAFNPCAFFVLLFLLSLLVNTKERWRMLLIGATFVLTSGLVYFMFMAAWLNLFLVLGELQWVTRIAALIAILIALINIKDYLWPQLGPSLSISDAHKPGLFQRMRGLLQSHSLLPLMLGTITLALVANSYELLCTSGLPMVFTRILTMQQFELPQYYGYLLLYNLIYVVPLLVIVLIFTYTLGRRKLQAHEGALLKLLSGLMMLGLGLVLALAPELLNSLKVTLTLMSSAIGLTLIIHLLQRFRSVGK